MLELKEFLFEFKIFWRQFGLYLDGDLGFFDNFFVVGFLFVFFLTLFFQFLFSFLLTLLFVRFLLFSR